MIEQKEILCSIPEKNLKNVEAYYSIIDEKVHLFISRKHDLHSHIGRLKCKEVLSDTYCQFLNCSLLRVGRDFDEYLVNEAYLGDTEESFEKNEYIKCRFFLTGDILPFFNTPWEIDNSFTDTTTRTLNFKSHEERLTPIIINENTTFHIHIGYKQSYSKIRYEARSSVGFVLDFKSPVSKQIAFDLVDVIASFYSLFCQRHVGISHIGFETSTLGIHYKGNKLTTDKEIDYHNNLLIEKDQIEENVEDSLPQWVGNYLKNKLSIGLLKDAEAVKDEQLKFICLSRCLEIFHKENFIIPKPPLPYYQDLHQFITSHSLSDITLDNFLPKMGITLAHRIYDLARSVFYLMKDDRLVFGHLTNLNMCQKIADTRNYYIHFSDTAKKKAWTQDELTFTNFQLTAFIKILFFKTVWF